MGGGKRPTKARKVRKVGDDKDVGSSSNLPTRSALSLRAEIERVRWSKPEEMEEHNTRWTQKAFIHDKGFTFEGLPPEIKEIIDRRGWGDFCAQPTLIEFNASVVREFYAILHVAMKKKTEAKEIPLLTRVTVRGCEVKFSSSYIEDIYKVRNHPVDLDYLTLKQRECSRSNYIKDAIRPFFFGDGPFPNGSMDKHGQQGTKADHKNIAHQFFHKIIIHRIQPTLNHSTWPVSRRIPVHAIYSDNDINLGNIIWRSILSCAIGDDRTPIFFPL